MARWQVVSAEYCRRPARVGGLALAISSLVFIGSDMRSWSTQRPSGGCCRLLFSHYQPEWRFILHWVLRSLGRYGRGVRHEYWRLLLRLAWQSGCADIY